MLTLLVHVKGRKLHSVTTVGEATFLCQSISPNSFDTQRTKLLPSYKITPNIAF